MKKENEWMKKYWTDYEISEIEKQYRKNDIVGILVWIVIIVLITPVVLIVWGIQMSMPAWLIG